MDKIVVRGNDAVGSGAVFIEYHKDAQIAPLHLSFKREDGLECNICLHHDAVKELLKLIVNNI